MIGTEWKFKDCKVVEQEADGNVVFDVHFPSGKVQRMYPDGIEDVEGCYAAFAMGISPVGQEDGHGNIVCEECIQSIIYIQGIQSNSEV